MLWKKTRAGVAANLIICIAFFMSGGVSQVAGETFVPEILAPFVSSDGLTPFVSSDGLTKRGGEQKSVEWIMCAELPGFPTPEKCLFKGQ